MNGRELQLGSKKRNAPSSTRSRLVLLVTAILTPIAVFALVLLWQFSKAERAHFRADGVALAQQLSANVDRELDALTAALEALATSADLRPGGDLARFDVRARQLVRTRGSFIGMRDRTGQQIVNTGVPFGAPLPHATDPVLLATDRKVFETGKPVVSDLYVGTVTHLHLILIDMPVFQDDSVASALSIALDPAHLSQLLAGSTPPQWTASLVDGHGKIIGRSRQPERYLGREATEDLRRASLGQSGTWTGTTLDGMRVLGAYVLSPLSAWRTAVGIPLTVVEAPLRQLTLIIVSSGLLVFLLSLALASLVSRTITRPIGSLTMAATRLGRGEKVPALVTGLREVDEVARALVAAQTDVASRESALLESEERFKAAVRAVEGVVWTNDAEGRMTRDQPGWAALTGQSPAAYQGFGWADCVHPEDAAPSVAALQEAVRERKTFVFEHRVRRHDGVYRRFSIRAVPVRGEAGAVREWVGVHTDITDEFEAKVSLAESRARLRAVFEAVPVGVVIAEAPRGRIVAGNAQTERIFGHPILHSADVEGYRHWGGLDADGNPLDPMRYPLARVIRGGEERPELEILYERADKRRIWVRLIGAPIRDQNGSLTGGVVAVLDIDREKRAEAELRELNATLERRVEEMAADRDRIWRISTDMMLVARIEGKILAVNPAWTTTLGWSESELAGRPFITLVHPEDVAAMLTVAASLGEGLTTLRFENRYRHKDGSYRWVSWTAVPGQGLIHAIGRDVTGEKEAAEALRRSEAQLHQSQKMEIVGQLTGGVAHDFNNLLTVVTGHLEMARRRLETEEPNQRLARNLDSALEGARRAAILTHRLLAFSRRSALRPEVLELNKIVSGMSELIRRTLGENIAIETVLAGGLWRVEADPNQVESGILNLCINARDAMPDGGKLTIETGNTYLDESYPAVARDEVKPGQYAMIAVCDTGTGMPPDVLEHVFEPFFTTKPVGQGTGLGLSQVFGFMRQSGGHASIYSELGEGTTVKLYFPRFTRAPERESEPPELLARPVEAGRGETILVIEDEDMVREFTVSALEAGGYRVLAAPDGPSGLALLEAHPEIVLLFTDVVLAGALNGRKVAQEARRIRPRLRVLFTTGYTRNAIIHHGRLDDDVEVITKPFTASALVDKLQRMLHDAVAG